MIDPLLLHLPTSIDTARLIIRVPQAGDGQALHAAVLESIVALREFLGSLPWVANARVVYAALALGVYGYAAVPRAGLGPATPPLRRYAVHTKRQGGGLGRSSGQSKQAGNGS